MAPGSVFVDHTTASAAVARELAAAAKAKGITFIDAPVSGGQAGAQNGLLTVMCGGDAAAFATAQPVAMAFARAVTLLGDSGAGQLAKMVNQICIASLVQGLSEAIAFGQRAGLDMAQVLDVIGKGAAQSWQMDNRGKDHGGRQVRLRLCRRLDAQGPGLGAGRGQAQWRALARSRRWWTCSMPTCSKWAVSAGYVQA